MARGIRLTLPRGEVRRIFAFIAVAVVAGLEVATLATKSKKVKAETESEETFPKVPKSPNPRTQKGRKATEQDLANLAKGWQARQEQIGVPYGFTQEDRRKGGLARAETMRKRKLLRDIANEMLSRPISVEKSVAFIEACGIHLDEEEMPGITIGAAIVMAQIAKALQGDTDAFKCVQATVGEKPVTQTQLAINAVDARTANLTLLSDADLLAECERLGQECGLLEQAPETAVYELPAPDGDSGDSGDGGSA